MPEAMRFELQSQMPSRVPVLKKPRGRVQRGGQNMAGIHRKGVQSLTVHVHLISKNVVQSCFAQPKSVRLM